MKRTIVFIIAAIVFALLAVSFNQPIVTISQQKPPKSQEELPKESPSARRRCAGSYKRAGEKPVYLVGSSKLSREDARRIRRKFPDLIIPKGETELAKTIRQQNLDRKQTAVENIERSMETWLRAHPEATAEEIAQRRRLGEYFIERLKSDETPAEAALPAWDWRDAIKVGAVENQAEGCNNCWALASYAAASCSLQLKRERNDNFKYPAILDDGTLLPKSNAWCQDIFEPVASFDDLMSCMSIVPKQRCQLGWHGRVFDFMVNEIGVPMKFPAGAPYTFETFKNQDCQRFALFPIKTRQCRPSAGYARASGWDYVNSPPDRVPEVALLKKALIEHGPLVVGIFMDDCLIDYRGGVFNEKNNRDVTHVVLLIGWDDKKEAWLIKNSWGEDWGEKGFGWVQFGSNNIGQFAAWIDAG